VMPIIQGLGRASGPAKAALLQSCSLLIDPQVRDALRGALGSSDPAVRTAAIRALCNSRDPELRADMLDLARRSTEPNVRSQAIRGFVRIVTEEENAKFSGPQRAGFLKDILAVANTQQEKWAVLAGLGTVAEPEALELVLPMVEQAGLQAEAGQAATQIAAVLCGSHPELARTALKKVIAVSTDSTRREAAQKILAKMDALADFITAWQMTGPYQESGKNFDALFDTVFAPERPDDKDVKWRVMPALTDPKQPWLMDFLKAYGGEQRVAYARTRIYSDTAQPARLELGTDDGVKAWLNGKVVHAHNVARPTTVGSDKVNINLKQGWNALMLKITQNNLGWEFCARVTKPDGSHLEGLRFDTNFAETTR